MFDLIKKDFIVGWQVFLGMLFLIPFITIITTWAMLDDFGGIIIGVFMLIVTVLSLVPPILSLNIDATHKADSLFAGLPLDRYTIVLARYITSILLCTLAYTLVILSCLIVVYIFGGRDPFFDVILSIRGIMGIVTFMFVLLFFILPFLMRYGSGRGFTMAIFFQLGLILAMPVVKFVIKAMSGIFHFDIGFFARLLESVLRWIMGLNTLQASLVIASYTSLIFLTSLILSIRFYYKRDL